MALPHHLTFEQWWEKVVLLYTIGYSSDPWICGKPSHLPPRASYPWYTPTAAEVDSFGNDKAIQENYRPSYEAGDEPALQD